MGTESVGRNGSNSTYPSGSAANVGGLIPTLDTAMTSHVTDTASTNVGGLIRVSVSRGVLRPSHSASGSITSAFKRSMYPMAFAWSKMLETKRLEYFEEFRNMLGILLLSVQYTKLGKRRLVYVIRIWSTTSRVCGKTEKKTSIHYRG